MIRPARRTGRGILGLALGLALWLAVGLGPAAAARSHTADGLVGHWTFDDQGGADSVAPGHPLRLINRAEVGPGLIGPGALVLDGQGAYAQTAGRVLDTTGSYSVSAWVKLTSVGGYQTFVSQDGHAVSGFFLQLRDGEFAFALPSADATSAPVTVAADPNVIPQPGEWYQLAGVVDAAAHTASLYVNGTLAATEDLPPAWSADGDLAVGRSLYGGAHRDFVHGEVDDVRAYAATLAPPAVAALAGPGSLIVDGGQLGARIRPTQFGEFLEEISHSGDGGLYAELIRNRDLKESGRQPTGWSAIGGPAAAIALTRTQPLTPADPVSLALSVPAGAHGGRAGIANGGWWGLPVRPATTYRVSFWVRGTGAGTRAPLTVDLESGSGTVWASAAAGTPRGGWRRETVSLRTPAGIPSSVDNRFVIAAPTSRLAGGSDRFTLVSVFPPTYGGLANGFRIDLMRRLAALRPGYLRIPGGNYLEGETVATRFDWRQTIGPLRDRPGHFDSAWDYWSQDGMGLLEYLELAQQLHARPILDVWAGYTLDHTVLTRAQLAPYVTQAVDELQYATGSTSTPWGHQRALDGHPAPFPVHMVEIGNEDFFDSTGSYGSYRYPMFYDAIHRAFPQIRMIASEPVTSRPVFAVDRHFYSPDPQRFARDAHLFDGLSRRGARVLVGEYGAVQGSPTGDMAAAVGEAAFLTGTIRNAGIVLGASYAPLLVNVNDVDWPTSLIGFDAADTAVSPSYEVQQLLADHLATRVMGTQLVAGSGTLFDVATAGAGRLDLAVVNDSETPAATQVWLNGLGPGATGGTATTISASPDARNTLADPGAVVPTSAPLTALGTQFPYTFPADSVTMLALTTSSP
jgi:hypothetical protein